MPFPEFDEEAPATKRVVMPSGREVEVPLEPEADLIEVMSAVEGEDVGERLTEPPRRPAPAPPMPLMLDAPPRERPGRAYTEGEIAGLRPIFGDAIDYSRVRIHDGADGNPIAMIAFSKGNPAITLGNHIFINPNNPNRYSEDYSANNFSNMAGFASFIGHESTHVWQHQNGGLNPFRYGWEYFTIPGDGYAIDDLDSGSSFGDLGYDRQGEVIRDFLLASRGMNHDGRPDQDAWIKADLYGRMLGRELMPGGYRPAIEPVSPDQIDRPRVFVPPGG